VLNEFRPKKETTKSTHKAKCKEDRAINQAVSRWLPTAAARVRVRAVVGFVVDKAVFSEYFSSPCQSFHQFIHHHHQPGLAQQAYWWLQCLSGPNYTAPLTVPIKKNVKKIWNVRN
jgi:hypothetical protein